MEISSYWKFHYKEKPYNSREFKAMNFFIVFLNSSFSTRNQKQILFPFPLPILVSSKQVPNLFVLRPLQCHTNQSGKQIESWEKAKTCLSLRINFPCFPTRHTFPPSSVNGKKNKKKRKSESFVGTGQKLTENSHSNTSCFPYATVVGNLKFWDFLQINFTT